MSSCSLLTISRASGPSPTEVVGRSTFDPGVLQRLTRGLEKEGRFAQKYEIADDEDQADVAERLVSWKRLSKKMKGLYEEKARPHLDALATLRELFKPFDNIVALGLGAYTAALGSYEIEKAERLRAALAEAKAAARERDSRALTQSLNAAQDARPQRLVASGGGGVSVGVVWQVDGQPDESKLPRKWMMADVKSLNKYAAGYLATETPPDIPGVTFKLGSKQTVRT